MLAAMVAVTGRMRVLSSDMALRLDREPMGSSAQPEAAQIESTVAVLA
jgi:hypothetical protein